MAKYSIVINAAGSATAYTTKAAAEAAFAALTVNAGESAYLYLEAMPTKENEKPNWSGTWTDAAGVVRVVGTGAEYVAPPPPEEPEEE
jgi:hypothetical protein